MTALRGALLDVDGTLIDSNDAHARSWEGTFREFGFHIPAARVRPLIGKGGDKLVPELTGLDADSDQAKRLSARRKQMFENAYLHHGGDARGRCVRRAALRRMERRRARRGVRDL